MSFVERLRAGDPDAWNQAFPCLYPVAYEAARSRLGNTHIAECKDVAIETLTDLLHNENAVSNEQELRSLVAAIARNKAMDRLRRLSAAKRGGNKVESIESLQGSGGCEPVGVTHEQFIDQLTFNELRDLLVGLALQIKKEHRVVLRDHYLNQMTYEEIATKYGISVNSVGVYLQRGLAAMKFVIARKPKLMSELLQLIGEGGMVRALLPLLSAIQLGRWFLETGVLYSEESLLVSPRDLSDEDRLRMATEILPFEASLQEEDKTKLLEVADEKYPARFEAWRNQREADRVQREAEHLRRQHREKMRRIIGVLIGLLLLALLFIAIAR